MSSLLRAAARPCVKPSFVGSIPSLLPGQPISSIQGTPAGAGPLPNAGGPPFEQQRRCRHSQTQVKRLMKNHPARIRAMKKIGQTPRELPVPKRKFPPVFRPRVVLSNGWSKPPSEEDGFIMPDYPFKVSRTGHKPNGATGFLPVYSKVSKHNTKHTTIIRKISGDHDAFVSELRAVLKLPEGTDDPVRVRTGGNVEIEGNRVRDAKRWLAELGF